ncbi:MAG: prepilin-type N-terminal cleavage/methylation domain-containing protein [Planctomycetota bacterium]
MAPLKPTTSIQASSRGFTLIEVMVAIMVTGILFTGFFSIIRTAINMQLMVREFSDAERMGPAILSQISEDLRNAYFYNLENNDCFEGKKIERGNDSRMDQIHFLTTRTSLVADEAIPSNADLDIGRGSPLSEVSYMLRESKNGYFELCRREQPFIDEHPFKGGYFRLICDRILSFKVQYTGWDFGESDDSPFGDNDRGRDNTDTPSSGSAGSAGSNGSNGAIAGANGKGNGNGNEENENGDNEDENGELVWEDDWSARDRGSMPVAVKIELVLSPDVDPAVMRRMTHDGRDGELEKSYLHIILLPQYREDPESTRATSSWQGNVAEPQAGTTGVAGGLNGRGARGGGANGQRGARGDQNGRGNGNRGNTGTNILGGSRGNNGGNNRLADILRGGG